MPAWSSAFEGRMSHALRSMSRWKLALILLLLLSSPLEGAELCAPASQPDQSVDSDDMLAPCRTTLELSGIYFVEAWNFNGRLKPDKLAGASAAVSFTIHDGLGAVVELLGMRVAQQLRDIDIMRPPAAYVGGLSGLLRKRIAKPGATTVFIEGGFGVSDATVQVPTRGTPFNFLFQAGGGFSRRLGQRTAFIVNMRLFHLSNAGLGGAHRNPDIEAFGAHAGVLIGF
jgi:hypothetical protein